MLDFERGRSQRLVSKLYLPIQFDEGLCMTMNNVHSILYFETTGLQLFLQGSRFSIAFLNSSVSFWPGHDLNPQPHRYDFAYCKMAPGFFNSCANVANFCHRALWFLYWKWKIFIVLINYWYSPAWHHITVITLFLPFLLSVTIFIAFINVLSGSQ